MWLVQSIMQSLQKQKNLNESPSNFSVSTLCADGLGPPSAHNKYRNIGPNFDSPKISHLLPLQVSYEMFIVNILGEGDHVT